MSVTYDITGTLRAQEHGHPPLIYDARGNGGGETSPTITGDHQNRITDYTAIVVEDDNNSKAVPKRDSLYFRDLSDAGKCDGIWWGQHPDGSGGR